MRRPECLCCLHLRLLLFRLDQDDGAKPARRSAATFAAADAHSATSTTTFTATSAIYTVTRDIAANFALLAAGALRGQRQLAIVMWASLGIPGQITVLMRLRVAKRMRRTSGRVLALRVMRVR